MQITYHIPNLRGIYSKQNAYTITNSGFATFIFDGTNTPTAGGGFLGTTTGNFMLISEPLLNCCVNFIGLKNITNTAQAPKQPKSLVNDNYLKLYPNPATANSTITMQYKFSNSGTATATIYNMQGQAVYKTNLLIPKSNIAVYINISNKVLMLKPGLYIVQVNNGKQKLTSKLVVAQ